MKNLGAELFGLVEMSQGYSFISDAISGLPKDRVLAIARGSLKHTEETARLLREFLKKHDKPNAAIPPHLNA